MELATKAWQISGLMPLPNDEAYPMRRIIIITLVGLLFPLGLAHANGLRDNDPETFAMARDNTFLPLFQAMQEGNVAVIKQYLHGKTYDEYRTLMDQNETYGEFLRNYYSGASFVLNDISQVSAGVYVADVSIEWTDGRKVQLELEVFSPPPPSSGEQSMKWAVGDPVVENSKAK
jgi:hypothetical protein